MAGRPMSLESVRTELLMEISALSQEAAQIAIRQVKATRELASLEERRAVAS